MKFNLKIALFSFFFVFTFIVDNSALKASENIFKDPVIRKIYTLCYDRNSAGLFPFLKSSNSKYRRYAAICLGSVQDVKSTAQLLPLLQDEIPGVRSAAAFAIGQTHDKKSEKLLIKAIQNEKNIEVKNSMLESLGKCGTNEGLKFLILLSRRNFNKKNADGISMGFFRFMLRKIYTEESVQSVIELLEKRITSISAYFSSLLLARMPNYDLTKFGEILIKRLANEKELFTRLNLILALAKIKSIHAKKTLLKILSADDDYRVKVNALRSLEKFDISKNSNLISRLCLNNNIHVSFSAANLILKKPGNFKQKELIKLSEKSTDPRTSITLMKASLKAGSDKKKMSGLIKKKFESSQFPVQKGLLLSALGEYPENFSFIRNQIFKTNNYFVKTEGMGAISSMFSEIKNESELKKAGLPSKKEILAFLKESVATEDLSLTAISALMLRNISFLRSGKINPDFLIEAMKSCKLPGDIETYQELKKTLDYLTDKKEKFQSVFQKAKCINWDLISKIPSVCRVKISTKSGDIILRLFVNHAPATVLNFLELIKKGFFNGTIFHRVVPNFVIQGGCSRGDGWGGPGYIIRSEFYPDYYREGSVGMASAGKDTEGSQWFITHSPTSHLDGRYTLFGFVESGMNVVHKIGLGSKISSIKIVEAKKAVK